MEENKTMLCRGCGRKGYSKFCDSVCVTKFENSNFPEVINPNQIFPTLEESHRSLGNLDDYVKNLDRLPSDIALEKLSKGELPTSTELLDTLPTWDEFIHKRVNT